MTASAFAKKYAVFVSTIFPSILDEVEWSSPSIIWKRVH